jgi:hypothetical protein
VCGYRLPWVPSHHGESPVRLHWQTA